MRTARSVQPLTGLHSSPSGVPGGSAGRADDSTLPMPLSALGPGAAVLGARRPATSPV